MNNMVKKVNHEELQEILKAHYEKKISVLVFGRFGIGKSEVICETAKNIARKKNREFVEWNRTNREKKEELFKNPEKYFVLIDVRLSENEHSDIKGLPVFNDDKRSIDFKSPMWALYMEQSKSDGVLFFDEISLAPPIVVSSCYKILYDRIINDIKIGEDWFIVGATNTDEDRAYTHELAPPIRDRGSEIELLPPTADAWTNWAIKNGVDSRIIGYLNFKQSNLWNVEFESNQKHTSPRGWFRLNKLINGEKDFKKIEIIGSGAIGEGIFSEFVAFCKIQEEIKLDELIKNPEKIKKLPENEKTLGIKYFIATTIAERYRAGKVDFEKIIKISKVLDEINNAEFVALLWRMAIGYKEKEFKEDFMSEKLDKNFAEKYSKWLI